MGLRRYIRFAAPLILLALFGLVASARISYAQIAPPDVFLSEAKAFRNIVQDGDLFVLIRYELPITTATGVADAWCALLNNQAGCDANPVVPEEPTSLLPGVAFISSYTGCSTSPFDCSAASIATQERPPRIDSALAGVYLAPGHGISWEDSTFGVCVESSSTYFSAQAQACINPSFNAQASDRDTQRSELGSSVIAMLSSLEAQRLQPFGTYVSRGVQTRVTSAGRIFALEALSLMDRIVPDAFLISAQRVITTTPTAVTGDSPLQASIRATVAATGLDTDLDNAAGTLGTTGPRFTIISGFAMGLLFGGLAWVATKSGVLFLAVLLTPPLIVAWADPGILALMMTIGVLLGFPTMMYILRKAPD